MNPLSNPVFCAVDTSSLERAETLAQALTGKVGGLKIGLEFFLAHGIPGYQRLASFGLPIFLDLKLHDIPNTVAKALQSLLPLAPSFITIHTSGGPAMMQQAVGMLARHTGPKPKLLGVTVLTSLDSKDLGAVGQDTNPHAQVSRLAVLAKDCGLDGIICSPEEVTSLRQILGLDFILMVPGIRPHWAKTDDQKRILTPRAALQAGATYLVIGRPITDAESPAHAATRIAEELVA